jgi:hypothetical protein
MVGFYVQRAGGGLQAEIRAVLSEGVIESGNAGNG